MIMESDVRNTVFSFQSASEHVGRIPVRNLWLLMLYASDLYRYFNRDKISIEENPDDIPDLVAELLCNIVERRLRRNLSYGYQPKKAILSRVRGRIDFLDTERQQLLSRGMVSCRFENLTVNTPRNRFVKAALDVVARIVRDKKMAIRCRGLISNLKQLGVTGEKPTKSEVLANQYGYHDAEDNQMVAAAFLVFELSIPTENIGNKLVVKPDRDDIWVRKLYEKAVGGFYKVVLVSKGWSVEPGKPLQWKIERKTSGIEKIFPSMKSDIFLEHLSNRTRIIIDTKFNSILVPGWHREETLRSGYIYQIYSYLRSQENDEDPLSLQSAGLLLHPSVNESIDETVLIQGHPIRFATVDLAATTNEIRARLLEMTKLIL
jgi:5-methylcytosine-specific restriction enzyme subunit McrC